MGLEETKIKFLSGIGLYNITFSNYYVLQRSDMKKKT
jgi:hypothetical protein